MTARFKSPALRRWLSPLVALVVILAMSPAALAATTPGAPTNLVATPGNGQVALTWAAPGSDGGSPITDYRVQYRKEGASTWVTFPDGTSTNLFATVTSLANGTPYQFRVRAINAVGLGAASDPVTVTPTASNPGAPGIPANLAGTPGDKKVTLQWDAPSDGGSPIIDYGVQQRAATASVWSTFPDGTSTATTATVTLLTNGTEYQFRVRARNAVGWGPWSTPITATPSAAAVVPGAPQNLVAVPGNGTMALTWGAPASNGGSPITDYTIQYKKSTAITWTTYPDGTSTNLFATVTLLVNGTSYDFRVRARNAIGLGLPSGAVTATPSDITVPGAPMGLTATPGNQQVAVSWSAPASDGGSPILDYAMRYRTGGGAWTTVNPAVSPLTVTSLANGTSYEFQAQARNAIGSGAWTASVFATPATLPGIPQNVTATPASGQVTVTWAAPADNGGSAIIDYALQYRTGGGAWVLIDPAASGVIASGLANGLSYEFQVRARNAVGSSAWTASVFATPATLPGAPQNLAWDPGSGQVTVTWTAPADNGGSAIIDYEAQYRTGGGAWTSVNPAASPLTRTGLTNGATYEFQVRARNAVGSGAWSGSLLVIPGAPDAPPSFQMTLQWSGTVILSWSGPADNGATVDLYEIRYRTGGGAWTTITKTPTGLFPTTQMISDLTSGSLYEFQVRGRNSRGFGPWTASLFLTVI